jgi:hypothetical protein
VDAAPRTDAERQCTRASSIWSSIGVGGFTLRHLALSLAHFAMTDTDNPLQGVWNVSAAPFGNIK